MSFSVSAANQSTAGEPSPISQTAPSRRDMLRLLRRAAGTRVSKALPTRPDVGSRGEPLVVPDVATLLPLNMALGTRSASDTSTTAEPIDSPELLDFVFAHLSELFSATESVYPSAEGAFELLFRHEGAEDRAGHWSRLVRGLSLHRILEVAGHHYDKYGNEDRLRLAARLAAAGGKQSPSALLTHLKSRPNDTIHFLGVIIDPNVFALEQQKQLVDLAASLGDPDVDEVLFGSKEWMSRELAEYVDHLEQQQPKADPAQLP